MKMLISDNASGVHPKIMQALIDCNKRHVKPYGNDAFTRKAVERFRSVFGETTDVAFVLTGTAANVIALSSLIQPFESVICAETGHVNVDECGAFERFSGSKLERVNGADGKLSPELIDPFLSYVGNEHHVQPRIVSISQVSEMGTVYTLDEIRALADLCHENSMYLHMDGARIANAVVSLGCDLKTMTVDAGVDILSFGGTKNGMMMGEAIVSFRPELTGHLKYIRKQGMHLASKMRFISAQFLAYLDTSVWQKNAEHANAMAKILTDGMAEYSQVKLVAPPEANMIFAEIPQEWNEALLRKAPFYVLDITSNLIRLVTSFDTQEEDVHAFLEVVKESDRE